ncbi:MAG: type II toxin-antitoxin system RelE/ParE family toxin [Acidobacteriaceae bacterium]|nr:type II toxin-antitoxin system RelE/ParE family toxin [Acidobacteriaceae bacterium]
MEKELNRRPAKMVTRIVPRLEALGTDPRPPGCKKLKGGENEWRIRIGDYRAVYEIDDMVKTV